MSNQIIVLRVQPIKDAKNQTSGYEVFDVSTDKKYDAEKNGLRHIMMHLAFTNGQYVYRYGKKWRRGAANAKIFTVYTVKGLAPIDKPAKKTQKMKVPVVDQKTADVDAGKVTSQAEAPELVEA